MPAAKHWRFLGKPQEVHEYRSLPLEALGLADVSFEDFCCLEQGDINNLYSTTGLTYKQKATINKLYDKHSKKKSSAPQPQGK